MLIATIVLYILVVALVATLCWVVARLRAVEHVAMYLGLERYEEIVEEAEEKAREDSARRMIDDEWHGEVL
jgi:hypothetical protein